MSAEAWTTIGVGVTLLGVMLGVVIPVMLHLISAVREDIREVEGEIGRVGSKVSKVRRTIATIEVKVNAVWTQFLQGTLPAPPLGPTRNVRPVRNGVAEPAGLSAVAARYVPPDGKYGPLAEHLLEFPGDSHMVTFAELDEMLDDGLPASARTTRQWWENSFSHVQGAAWLSAGWEVAHMGVDFANERVLFKRVK